MDVRKPGADNVLLANIPANEREVLERHLTKVDLPARRILYEPGEAIERVYFPTAGVVSMVNEPNPGEIVEFATIGKEGFVGFPILLGSTSMPSRTLVQVPGSAYALKAAAFLEALPQTPALQRILMRHVMALLNQIAQVTSCNRLHEVQERCARWLLQTHDRVDEDSFLLTQDFLAQMLGVQRPTVSIAASMLQQAGLIRYSRGTITIVDREGLEAASCSCYRTIVDEYRRLLE